MPVILDAVSSIFSNALFSAAAGLPNHAVIVKVDTLLTADVQNWTAASPHILSASQTIYSLMSQFQDFEH